MSAGVFCNRDVVFVAPEATVEEAADLMRSYHVGCLVVVRNEGECRQPVGMITDRDLVVEILAQRIDPSTVAVADFMSSEPLTAHEDDSLWQTIRRMSAHGVRRMPVVDARGSLVGLLSVDDILDLLSAELSQLTTLAIREQTREKEVRP
jgi:CBS domain-containing protein